MANVLFLRSPSQGTPDPYEESFENLGYKPLFVPVLETVFTNFEVFKQTVVTGPKIQDFTGVIITSARACEAWGHVVKDLMQEPLDNAANWSLIPFYVVGEATAKALAAVNEISGPGPCTPSDIHGGSQTGTSERLAHFILNDLSEREGNKLLYLTGDKNRDTLPKILAEGCVALVSLQVYETRPNSRFAKDLESVVKSTPAESSHWWIVFFAPSAAEFATPLLRHYFGLPTLEPPKGVSTTIVNLAAIGPTTFAFLGENLKLRVAVCSPKPTPEALAAAVKAFETRD